MKKIISVLFCIVLLSTLLVFNVSANNYEDDYLDIVITETDKDSKSDLEPRATGLIYSYSLGLSKSGTTLFISGKTIGTVDAVKTGFKNLVIQRRKTTSDSWETYHDYGNFYRDDGAANLSTTLVVEAGYQYRISCKHYAKKNLLSTQTISNTSNIVTVS